MDSHELQARIDTDRKALAQQYHDRLISHLAKLMLARTYEKRSIAENHICLYAEELLRMAVGASSTQGSASDSATGAISKATTKKRA